MPISNEFRLLLLSLIFFEFGLILLHKAISTATVFVFLCSILTLDLFPNTAYGLALEQFLIDTMGKAWCFVADFMHSFDWFILSPLPGFTKCFCRFGFVKKGTIAKGLMLPSVPNKRFWIVLFFHVTTLNSVLLKEQVQWSVTATPACNVDKLIIVPVLRKHLFRPSLLPAKLDDQILGAILTHESAKHDNCIRTEIYLAIKAPFIVRILN